MCTVVNLCVLCLKYDETLESIFSQDNGIVIEEKCRFILNENVNIRPEVSYICFTCLKHLNFVYDFKQMCLQNIETFNNYVDTLETTKYLKVTVTDLQYQKKMNFMWNNESAKEISPPIEVVLIKEEIDDNCVLQDGNVFEEKETIEENDEFSTQEKLENINDNMQYSSSLNEEHHIIVKKETEFNIIAEEIQIKDECLFEATDSDSEDISNNKLVNEGTNKPDNFTVELKYAHSTADDDKKTSKNCNAIVPEGGKSRKMDQNVNKVKRFKCDKCHKAFTYPSRLKIHSHIHTGERPFKCSVCEKSFTKSVNLSQHMRIHTGEKLFHCQACPYKCTQAGHLKMHMRKHTGEKPFQCQVCKYKFTRSASLQSHMRIHTGEKLLQCQVCQYKCTRAIYLKTHMQIHTGEKPFQCQVCKYKFSRSANLQTHMRIHTGEKLFQCQVCEYKCTRAEHLTTHMRIHTGEKPFHCLICQYKCARACGLKKHMQIHTGDKPFKCKHCQKPFRLDHHLKQHMETQHTDMI